MPSLTHSSSQTFHIRPLSAELSKESLIGAEVVFNVNGDNILDTATLSTEDVDLLRQALYDHSVLVIRKQTGIDPNTLPKLAAIWDEKMVNLHSLQEKAMKNSQNILSRMQAQRLPNGPQITLIGSGNHDGYAGIENLTLRHVNHTEFHAEPCSEQELADGETRFYRWHMDAPLYDILPGRVTLLHGLIIPNVPDQKIKFENGSILPLAAGATAFVSGARAFQLLTPSEQQFALNTVVQYGPRPYEWIRNCKATSDGLSIQEVGQELPLDDLEAFTWDKVQAHPMVWRNPGRPTQPHLQILGTCVMALITTNPVTGIETRIDDLAEVRKICHSLQKKAMAPENIYAHSWKEGDLVIFHNQGVWHSITGQLDGIKRLMWQCTMRSESPPEKMMI